MTAPGKNKSAELMGDQLTCVTGGEMNGDVFVVPWFSSAAAFTGDAIFFVINPDGTR